MTRRNASPGALKPKCSRRVATDHRTAWRECRPTRSKWKNVERRRLLIPADQLEPKLQAAFAVAREAWAATAPRLARELPADPDERERALQVEFEAFLHRMADWAKADVEADDFD
jgi:hypothetical protein